MATTNDLKNGMTLNLEGQLWNVVEFQHVKPGKGPAFVRTKLKNVLSGEREEDRAIAEDAKKGIVRARKPVQANINAAPGTAAGEGGPPQ